MLYKFKTMANNAEIDTGPVLAAKDDPRITKIGKILRPTRIDELPQLFNVIIGDMSLVGPRSLAIGEIVTDEKGRVVRYEEVPGFWERLSVRPGLTGMATVYVPKDATPRRKFRYDLFYIRKQSFWLDLRLIVLSFWISFRGRPQ